MQEDGKYNRKTIEQDGQGRAYWEEMFKQRLERVEQFLTGTVIQAEGMARTKTLRQVHVACCCGGVTKEASMTGKGEE